MSGKHELLPMSLYIKNFSALTFLMALTVGVYYLELGPLSFPVAFGIAIAKATCIILIFMNVKYSSSLVRVMAGAGFFWLIILLAFTLSDVIFASLGTPYTDSLPRM